jgi:hypothetical protein
VFPLSCLHQQFRGLPVVHLAECQEEEILVLLGKVLGLHPWNNIARPVHCLRVVILNYLHRDEVKINFTITTILW